MNLYENTIFLKESKNQVLYHGSMVQDLKILIPKIGRTPDGKQIPRIFATTDRLMALGSIQIDAGYEAIGSGYITEDGIRGLWHLKELSKDSFNLFKTKGSIYTLDVSGFKHFEGGISVELISTSSVKVLKEEKINNVYNELMKLHKAKKIVMIKYDEDHPHNIYFKDKMR